MGALYARPNSPYFWMKYYVAGRPVRESTGTAKEKDARELLKRREGAAAEGRPVAPHLEKIRYEEVRNDLLAHYEATGDHDVVETGYRLRHLDAFFRGRRLVSIGPTDAHRYTTARRGQGRGQRDHPPGIVHPDHDAEPGGRARQTAAHPYPTQAGRWTTPAKVLRARRLRGRQAPSVP
jgi:hypothetical protein